MASDALHGPGSTRLGSQSREPSESRKGAEPSAGAWRAVPGQRRTCAGLQAGEALRRAGSA